MDYGYPTNEAADVMTHTRAKLMRLALWFVSSFGGFLYPYTAFVEFIPAPYLPLNVSVEHR
ncbi:Uncharacterised protein [Porphyromonas crevioricanis]|uniref:Uncharacterized protein n=1 Tax=Porphyromonas crevioricanis TaxID=393921 RepID=A0A2X4PFD4_9PORP|nr:hypothetical protein [Porphyromonas crevioricanis]SKA02833.1 hypothetical protein SAMN02745203_01647 [Porphyromonas crevioricanis]SQH72616.1 Uncharacterised protein [Porphyromonas crevioricanis]